MKLIIKESSQLLLCLLLLIERNFVCSNWTNHSFLHPTDAISHTSHHNISNIPFCFEPPHQTAQHRRFSLFSFCFSLLIVRYVYSSRVRIYFVLQKQKDKDTLELLKLDCNIRKCDFFDFRENYFKQLKESLLRECSTIITSWFDMEIIPINRCIALSRKVFLKLRKCVRVNVNVETGEEMSHLR